MNQYHFYLLYLDEHVSCEHHTCGNHGTCMARPTPLNLSIYLYIYLSIYLIYLDEHVSCEHGTCGNHGTCRARSTPLNLCDCQLTSFTGPKCLDGELQAYIFLGGGTSLFQIAFFCIGYRMYLTSKDIL